MARPSRPSRAWSLAQREASEVWRKRVRLRGGSFSAFFLLLDKSPRSLQIKIYKRLVTQLFESFEWAHLRACPLQVKPQLDRSFHLGNLPEPFPDRNPIWSLSLFCHCAQMSFMYTAEAGSSTVVEASRP